MTENLWLDHHQALRRFICAKVDDIDLADDILQEVFIKVHNNRNKLTNIDNIEAWLYQVCRRTIVDFYRSRMSRLPLSSISETTHALIQKPATNRQQLQLCINKVINELPDNYQTVLRASELKEQKQAHLAKQLNLSLTALKSRLKRARQQLRKQLSTRCDFDFNEYGTTAYCKKRCGCSA